MNEVIYQLKAIMEDLGFVQSSLIHTMELMKSSEDFEDFVKERHLEEKLTQSRQFALGASMRLKMAEKAFDTAQAENAALRAENVLLKRAVIYAQVVIDHGLLDHNETYKGFLQDALGKTPLDLTNPIAELNKIAEALKELEAGGEGGE